MDGNLVNNMAFTAGNDPLDTDKPTLIMIHGAGLTSKLWQAQVTNLCDIANTVAVDLPGHGQSPGEASSDIAVYADAVRGFVEKIKAPRPIVCGLSMGGAVALELLLRHGSRFSGGVLMHTGAKLKVHPLMFETLDKGIEGYFELMCYYALAQANANKSMARQIQDIAVRSSAVARADFTACNTFDRMDDVARINGPVLVITGNDDNITPKKYGRYLADWISGARHENIDSVGHLSPLERPEKVNQLLRKFVQRTGRLSRSHKGD
ncbi:MAG: alpha/beta fold hydrolase [Thermodesulfobacteriota bacterium]